MTCENTPYDAIPYPGTVVRNTAPPHLALCSLWHGGPRPPIKEYRFMELGCGEGANLLPLAFYNPDSTFIGIDNSEAELHRAEQGARFLGLKNIQLIHGDIRELSPREVSPADYIVAHGLYSWVSEDVRQALLNFCRQALAPNGLAYISYNAQPGWANRRIVRETLLRSTAVREASIEDKAARAIEVATQLLQDLPSNNYAFGVLLAEELERVRGSKPGYVFHEYLTEFNDGFWFRDFVDQARSHGLAYVADAQFGRWEGHVPDEIKTPLAERGLEQMEREEAADLLGHRYFRASILCRTDAERTTLALDDLFEELYVAASLSAESDPFDLTDGLSERFSGNNQAAVTLEASITKAAAVLLASQWPDSMAFETLFAKAVALLNEHQYQNSDNPRALLQDDLITLFQAGQIELSLQQVATQQGGQQAHKLARYEAAHREALTTPHHMQLPFDAQVMALVRTLNGTKSLPEIQREFSDDYVQQTLRTLQRWGLTQA